MDQYFDNIQISDKGMVKLIRNNGKDYIFPASKIITVHRVKPNDDPNSWIPIAMDLCNILNVDAFQETRPYTVCVETDEGYLYVNIPYTEQLYNRLDNAHAYSTNIAKEKYGTFK
ncbi:hypothetical protein FMQ39_18280 [Salmonella enterica]|nr:hypothetical protein [Salmonella enterica]